MVVNDKNSDAMDLYVVKNLESLKTISSVDVSKFLLPKSSYLKSMDTLDQRIHECYAKNDNEKEYMYLYRYMQLCTVMNKVPDSKNKNSSNLDMRRYAKLSLEHMDRLEKLESILRRRYDELNSNKGQSQPDSTFSLSVEISQQVPMDDVEPHKSNHESIGKMMDCTKLYSLLNSLLPDDQKPTLLLIDCRSKEDFAVDHILYEESINIPHFIIQNGMSAAVLQVEIEDKYKAKWLNRHKYDIVVLLDRNSTRHEMDDPLLSIVILKQILTRWDIAGTFKCLTLLDGGFEDFQSTYPHMTSNPMLRKLASHNIANNMLEKFDYPEVPEIVPPKPPEAAKTVTPAVNRMVKPKIDFTALKEFKNQEDQSKQVENEAAGPTQDRGEPTVESTTAVSKTTESRGDGPESRESFRPEESTTSDAEEQHGRPVDYTFPDPAQSFVGTSSFNEGNEKVKSILKTSEPKMSESEKAAFVENLRKVKPKTAEPSRPDNESMRMDYTSSSGSSSDDEERVPLKKDAIGSSNMKRSLSSPNIAKAKDDDIITTPGFSRSNKPSYTVRPHPTPYIIGENIDAVYGKTQVGLTGLKNFANNCYMNSILQCLSNTEPLVRQLINLNKPALNSTSSTRGQVANVFISALRCIWSGEVRVYSIRELKNLMGNYKEIFKGANHQDSHEFLIILLEYLHDDLNIPTEVTVLAGASESSGEKAWGEFRKKNQSIIQHLFYGQEQSSVTCRSCSHKSVTFDHFFNLSVPIPDSDRTSLEECIQVYLKGENIIWTCPKCKVDRNAVKKLDITRLPPILIIALKRFSQEGQSSWLEKKETLVTYPLENLDMRSLTLPDSEQRHTRYNLHALSTHTGTLRAGHYRAICQNSVTSKWYLFDDSSVHSISQQEVRNNPEVYILFYHAVK